ncbi:MAG: carbohydrate kinase family protein [Galactobacter sp.]
MNAEHTDASQDGGKGELDVLMAGMLFMDIVFTDLPSAPQPGTEIWAGGMGTSPGGIANLAVATARLGLSTGIATTMGDDGYGSWARTILETDEGIDLTHTQTLEHWHTPVTVSMAYDGDRAMLTHGHRSPITTAELVRPDATPRAILADLDEDPWWRPAAGRGSKVFADVGWDPTETWDPAVLRALDGCHCFMPNSVEARAYTRKDTPQEALKALAELVPVAVVTLGAEGAIAIDNESGERVHVATVPATAIDPTGAGDVFGASFVVGTLEGWTLEQRLKFSSLCSSLAVQQFGGSLAAPGWGDVADWWGAVGQKAAAGDPHAAQLRQDYAFLPDLIPPGPVTSVRRAEATIARLADVTHGPDLP